MYKKILTLLIILALFSPIISTMESTKLSYKNILIESNNENELVLTEWIGSYILIPKSYIESCNLYCHIPVIHNGQSPIIIDNVWSEPTGQITGFSISQNYTGSNTLLNISFNSLNPNENITIFYSVSSIIKSKDYDDLPSDLDIPSEEELPNETKKWLESSEFIQSDHWRIKLLANLLKGINNNLIKTANRVTLFTGKIIRYNGYFSQDALSSLRLHFAVCTGKANLGAALLRAIGVPSRVLMVYPTHYIIEYYAHPYGWIRAETTIGEMPYPNQAYTVAYCAYPTDETSSNTVNGQSPYLGVIAYWGISNPNVYWTINYEQWSFKTKCQISTRAENINESLSLTKKTWGYFSNYTDRELNLSQTILYYDAVEFQKTAILLLKDNNITGYIENIRSACETFEKIE